MNESESKNEKPKESRFSQEQYDFLKECSEKGEEGIKKWNTWRKDNPNEEILLEGANLKGAFLENANLINARFCPEYWKKGKGEAEFREENKDKFANLENTKLGKARLQNAILNGAHLNESNMTETCLRGATLVYAKLEKAILLRANLLDSVLEGANIKGAEIDRADLQRANFRTAIIDGSTEIWKPKINRCVKGWDPSVRYTGKRDYTDFQGVALDGIRTDPITKQLLEYNIRRSNWEQWYKYKDWQGPCREEDRRHIVIQKLMWFIRLFWWFKL